MTLTIMDVTGGINMMKDIDNIYDTEDEIVLKMQGWKPYKDSTIKSMSKDDLIDYIRALEHNWAVEIKGTKLIQYRLECFYNKLKELGNPELFSEICATPKEKLFSSHLRLKEHMELINKLQFWVPDRDDYWYHSWFKSQRMIRGLKEGIKDIKTYEPKYYDKDLAEWFDLDIDYLIDNALKSQDIDDKEYYFTEDENKAVDKYIKEHSVEPQNNFFDYYKDKEKDDNNE